MSSGRHEMVINTQERAVSSDINRLQKFSNQDTAELWRLILAGSSFGLYPPGGVTYPTGGEAPVQGEVIGGLMARPSSGSFAVSVDAGIVMFLKPDGATDDSDFKFIRDPGINTGIIAFAANSSGSIRIDVLEVSINSSPAVVTDSRDIFDIATGLFIATTVTKETKAQLSYRIRQGTPGGGYPSGVGGWMPLMVASVPNGAASNDDITFWDVRPLFEDRVTAGAQGVFLKCSFDDWDGRLHRVSSSSAIMNGRFAGTLKGRKVGGTFAKCVPTTGGHSDTHDSIDVGDTDNQDTGLYAEPLASSMYVYACFPFGFQRMAMYDQHPASRVPRSPNGMLIVSNVPPDIFGGNTSLIPLPAITGFASQSVQLSEAVCVGVIPKSGEWTQFFVSGKYLSPAFRSGSTLSVVGSSVGVNVTSEVTIDHDFFPPNAKYIDCNMTHSYTYAASTQTEWTVFMHVKDDITGGSPVVDGNVELEKLTVVNTDGGASHAIPANWMVRIPRTTLWPNSDNSPRDVGFENTANDIIGGSSGTVGTTLRLRGIQF